MTNKTHYRKVFKSDHLGCADLEEFMEAGSDLIFTIDRVQQERGAKVAGKNIDANIAYFKEKIKPLVLNATNSKTMRKVTGSAFIEDWCGTRIQLYIDGSAKLMGEVVGGVRIRDNITQNKKAFSQEDINRAADEIEACTDIMELMAAWQKIYKFFGSNKYLTDKKDTKKLALAEEALTPPAERTEDLQKKEADSYKHPEEEYLDPVLQAAQQIASDAEQGEQQ